MKNRRIWDKWALVLLCVMTSTGCSGQPAKNNSAVPPAEGGSGAVAFTLPAVPANLLSPEERAAYVVGHYWDNFDFADTTLISKPQITEQAFADYINLFSHATEETIGKSVSGMLGQAIAGSSAMFEYFTELYEKYLDDPNSPFRQEDYFITVMRAIIANDQVDDIYKVRPRYQLETALKNRVGDIASDFGFTQRNGRTAKLSGITAEYVVLFFNNPDCTDCARVKEVLSQLTDPRVKIVAIYPDEDVQLWRKAVYPESWVDGRSRQIEEKKLYDLRAIPTLYLLDKNKRVMLKDAPVEVIIDWLNNHLQ